MGYTEYEPIAIPLCYSAFLMHYQWIKKTVLAGVEPATFRLTAECSNQLS